MPPQHEIGIAVIGVGWIGQVHCQAYRQIPDVYPDLPVKPRIKMIVDAVPVESGRLRGAHDRIAAEIETQ